MTNADNSSNSSDNPQPDNGDILRNENLPNHVVHPEQPGPHSAQASTNPAQYENDIASLSPVQAEEELSEQPTKKRSIFVELLIWAGVTIAIVLIIQNFIFQAFYVSGSSMEPSFQNNDYLIISKVPLSAHAIGKLFGQKNIDIHRGDVLVFRYPNAPETFFVKRALALPGERITIKNGVITIYNKDNPNGLVLQETYTDPEFTTEGNIDEIVEEGKVFVVGDNRSPGGSFDSREWGQLDQKEITGIATLRLLPINNFTIIRDPEF